LAECLGNLNASIRESGADIQAEPLPSVQADASQLAQLFQNILGNAIKFAAPGRAPAVRISAQSQGSEWVFSIADKGIGIEMEFAEQIFLMFKRLHSRSAYAGTGIGLAICQTIVDRHGGRIWVESAPGQGATFKFTLREVTLDR
jgi:light-regulated signal transduction histidine kinase (bacteriophytochrome)